MLPHAAGACTLVRSACIAPPLPHLGTHNADNPFRFRFGWQTAVCHPQPKTTMAGPFGIPLFLHRRDAVTMTLLDLFTLLWCALLCAFLGWGVVYLAAKIDPPLGRE